MAVDDLSDWAVSKAARAFIKGEVEDHDRRFAPSAAQFAAHAKRGEIAESTVAFVARHPELLEQTEYPAEYRAEMRRRVSALLTRLPRMTDDNHQVEATLEDSTKPIRYRAEAAH